MEPKRRARKSAYTCIVVHQFDPEVLAPGGIDTCIRGLVRNAPTGERILIIGTSGSRRLYTKVGLALEGRKIDFLPVSRVRSANQKRMIPHSIRLVVAAFLPLLFSGTASAVLHSHRIETGLLQKLVPARGRVCFVHTDVAKSLGSQSDSFWRYAPMLYRRIESVVLSKADLCVVFNKDTAARFQRWGWRVFHSTTWFNEQIFFHDGGGRDIDVAWVGRLEEPKDPVLGVQVMRRVVENDIAKQVVIIGGGTLEEEVNGSLGNLADCMRGPLSQQQVAEVMKRTRILLMTSHFEGSPVVLYEALASGAAIVATKSSDPDGVVQDGVNGRIVSTREVSDLAEAVRSSMQLGGAGAARTVREQRSDRVVPQIWRRIEECCRGPEVLVEHG